MNLAIITSKENAYSETFIRQHIELLDFNVSHYYGLPFPIFYKGVNQNSGLLKPFNRIYGKLRGIRNYDYHEGLRRSFKKNEIDGVLVEYGPNAMKILPAVKSAKLPLIVHFHGYDLSAYHMLDNYDNYRELYDYAQAFIVVSKFMHKQALEMGFPEEKVYYNVYGPHDRFLELEAVSEGKTFLSVGRLTEKKAPALTIRAFQKVVQTHPDATLLIAGDGELTNSCKALVSELKLEQNVEFKGVVTPQEVALLMQKSTAFVQHSMRAKNGDMEGTPLAILEAQAIGLPVISTFHAGIPDVVVNGKTGFLVEEGDYQKMGEYMIQLIENPDLARAFGQDAKQRIKTHFTLDRHLNELSRIIREAVNNA